MEIGLSGRILEIWLEKSTISSSIRGVAEIGIGSIDLKEASFVRKLRKVIELKYEVSCSGL